MNNQEIKCPNCGKVFQVDEGGYAAILKQVHDTEFEKEVKRLEDSIDKKKSDEIKIATMEQEKSFTEKIKEKDSLLAEKDREIDRLTSQIEKADTEKELAITSAIHEKEQSLFQKEAEIDKLKNTISLQERDVEIKEKNLLERHKDELRIRDEEIERLKDFKAKLSTKMVGESLEQHCQSQFNQFRMAAFPNAYFEKDNDSKSGSKGDFIFRESSEDTEFISIMFEMKTEMDTTEKKHKNEDFFKELDKDRNEKNCEYAVLVTTLEMDSDLYNSGIVDVSYRYPKMFVVRPQFFIPIISLLRNAALNSLEYKKKLEDIQKQQLDIYNFEQNLETFKNGFAYSFEQANKRFSEAIKGIDNAIDALTKIREKLVTSGNHLNAANNKLDAVSIKKLTNNAPSVREMFEEIKTE